MQVKYGTKTFDWPGEQMGELRDANALLGDAAAMRRRLDEDGYLLLRKLIDPDKVLTARAAIFEYMAEREGLEPDSRPLDGVMGQYGKGVGMMGRPAITHSGPVADVLAGEELHKLYGALFGEPALTFDYKWLRAVGNEEYTGAHYDVVYMGRGSDRLMTCWVPFGRVSPVDGALAMCVGSHNLPSFEKLRQTYGRLDVDRDPVAGGWFTREPFEITDQFGGEWATTIYEPGDVITFGMYTMHASTTNLTDRWRLSCDVRYQPAGDPVDERWMGEQPPAHSAHHDQNVERRSLESYRAEWGI